MSNRDKRERASRRIAPRGSAIHIDGDFPTGKKCRHHCSPTCHPAQVGPDWKYGCLHPDWPENREGDFPPIVRCGGNPKKCELSSDRAASAQHVRNCEGVGVRPDSPDAWANRPWHRRQKTK